MTRVFVAALTALGLLLPSAGHASASNQAQDLYGQLEITDWSTSETGGRCGALQLDLYNNSNLPVAKIKVLVHVRYDAQRDGRTKPFRGTASKSWVTAKMYLKPGKSLSVAWDLCSNVPFLNADPDDDYWRGGHGRIFVHRKLTTYYVNSQ